MQEVFFPLFSPVDPEPLPSMKSVKQKIFPPTEQIPDKINIRRLSERHAGVQYLVPPTSPSSVSTLAIGVACHISNSGQVEYIALANTETVFCIEFSNKIDVLDAGLLNLLAAGGESLGDDKPNCCLVGFSMARIAVLVHSGIRQRIRGVDLSDLALVRRGEGPRASPPEIVLTHFLNADRWQIAQLWLGDESLKQSNVCLQAWLAACVGNKNQDRLTQSRKIDTNFVHTQELQCVTQMVKQSAIIESQKPVESSNDFNDVSLNKDGKAVIDNSRFKSRVRRNADAQVIMTNTQGRQYVASARYVQGRRTTLDLQGHHRDIGEVTQVKVIGRAALTNSENAREELIHLLLTGRQTLLDSVFVRALWFPKLRDLKRQSTSILSQSLVDDITAKLALNESQCHVVRSMVGDQTIVVAHGPPGTGKTTTIAAASRIWDISGHFVWIVAHSNVAVKNIAETFYKKEVDFKLLVSQDFYREWHEHLYADVERRVIRSDELPDDITGMAQIIGTSRIILSTLSMVSNPALKNNGTFKVVPLERLIIDEASQINIHEFMHIFVTHRQQLEKVCFFGDPEQLPPFGQEDIQSIETIFNLEHVMALNRECFLDTQYRMPVPVGNFISQEMYNRKLKSHHRIYDPGCVKFINVSPPRAEEKKSGTSWTNEAEVITIVHLVKNYYQSKNFCVITPYDAQRAAIERALKAVDLPWDSVYNLDSFQGNEADYLLISVVRTGVQAGFLTSRKRMNVMLTRCRRAAIVVTSKTFMALGGAKTLLGKMVRYWQDVLKSPEVWVDWNLVADECVDLPDALGAKRNPLHRSAAPVISTPSLSHSTPSTLAQVSKIYRGPSGGFSVASLFRDHVQSAQAEQIANTPFNEQNFPSLARQKEPISKGSRRRSSATADVSHGYPKALQERRTYQFTSRTQVPERLSYACVASLRSR